MTLLLLEHLWQREYQSNMYKTVVKAVLYCYLIKVTTALEYTSRCDAAEIPQDVAKNVKFFLYTRNNLLHPIKLSCQYSSCEGRKILNDENPTVVYIHGFTQNVFSKASQKIKDAYMLCGYYNVIMMDWGPFGFYPNYNAAVNWLPSIGKFAALTIKSWQQKGMISVSKLHIIGNSLGAHISGIIGEELAKLGTEKIGRITGLDPAGPKFEKKESSHGMLDKEDAIFVDVIHTDTRIFGIKRPIGHVDFYVNGGKSQPGCIKCHLACSHRRAREYYIESILNPYGFPASECEIWRSLRCRCKRKMGDIMGFGTHPEMSGIFAVKTRRNYPFAVQTSSYAKIVPCGMIKPDNVDSDSHPLLKTPY